MIDFNILLFDGFETLDAFGPAEIIGKLPDDYKLAYYSLQGGIIQSAQNIQVQTLPLAQLKNSEHIFLIPGGIGTRELVEDEIFLKALKEATQKATWLLSVCTGSALLAKAGLLQGKKATSNKRAFTWVTTNDPLTEWIAKARWVVDGHIYTSSGVSAGMDMTLAFISDTNSPLKAQNTADTIEYLWNQNKDYDPFCRE